MSPYPSLPALLLGSALAAASCGGAQTGVTSPAEGLPAYSAEESGIFNDDIARDVFGTTLGGAATSTERQIAERAKRAEGVIVAKVATVNTNGDSHERDPKYQLMLQPIGAPLSGEAPHDALTLEISPQSPAYQLLHSADASFVGKTLIVFYRRYNDGGQVVVHFRGEPDTPAVRAAIHAAH